MKKVFISLLIGVTFFSIGCTNTKEVEKYLIENTNIVNEENCLEAQLFKIEKDKIEIGIIAREEIFKRDGDEYGLDVTYEDKYNQIRDKGFKGKVYINFGYYNEKLDRIIFNYRYYYDDKENGVLEIIKEFYTESELIDYYK